MIEWGKYSDHALDKAHAAEDVEDEGDAKIPGTYDHQKADDEDSSRGYADEHIFDYIAADGVSI